MATKAELISKGYTEQQIQDATQKRNLATMSAKLGQNIPQAGGITQQGQVDAQTPVNARSMTGGVQINTEAMKKYNPDYNPNVASGVSGITGTQPAKQPVVEPVKVEQPLPQTNAPVTQPKVEIPPTQVEKTTTTTPEGETVVKKETPQAITPDYNTGKGREQDIFNNLQEGYTKDPAIQKAISTGDYEAYKQSYGYDTADETKKKLLDGYFQARQPKDADGIFQSLKTGVKIMNPETLQSKFYNTAKTKYDMYSRLIGMSSDQLLTEMKNNNIGSEMDKELMASPQYQEAKQKYNQYLSTKQLNSNNQAISDAIGGRKTEQKDTVQSLSDKIMEIMKSAGKSETDMVSYRDYLAKNNPDLVTKVSELNAKNKLLREKTDARDAMYKTVIEQYPGMTKGAAIALASRMNEPLNEDIKSMAYEMDVLQSDIKYQQDIASKDYEFELKQQERQDTLDREARGYGIDLLKSQMGFEQQKQLYQYKADLDLETNKKEFDQKLAQQTELASDPYTAISTIMEQYSKLGVPFTESIATKLQNFENSGQTIGEYTKQMISDIQKKPEYKRINAIQLGQMSDMEKLQYEESKKRPSIQTIKSTINGKTVEQTGYFDENGKWNIQIPTTGGTGSIQDIVDNSIANRGTENLQCGQLVNDYWKQVTGSTAKIGDTLNSKYGAISNIGRSETPEVGGIFVSNPLNNSIGHTGIVQSVNGDGSITVLEANAQGKPNGQPPILKTYSAQQVTNMRFSKSPSVEQKQTTTFKTDAIPQYESFLKTGKISENVATLEAIQAEFGSVENFRKQAEAYNNSETGPRQKELNKITKLREQLKGILSEENSEALSNTVGSVQFTASPWTAREKEAFLGEIQNFLDGKTLQQLIDVKEEGATFGALSNEELRMLQNSASKLNQIAIRDDEDDTNRITGFRGSEANFKAKVQEMVNLYDETISKKKKEMGKDISGDILGAGSLMYNGFNLPK